MKILLVTSRVTYVEDNYYYLLKRISERLVHHDLSILIINNLSAKLLIQSLGLLLIGAQRLGSIILKNMITSFIKKREGLFNTIFYSKNINNEETIDQLSKMNFDLIINLRTRNIYKERVLSMPTIGCINVHHGLLPDNRGTMCDLWGMYDGRPIGFSIHWMTAKIDAGDIIVRQEIDVKNVKDYSKVPYISSRVEADILCDLITDIDNGVPLNNIKNKSGNIRFTKNPTIKEIFMIKKRGILL